MGYTTEFSGQFDLNKKLIPELQEYLKKFAQTRRMKRDVSKLPKDKAPFYKKMFGGFGPEGAYYVDGSGSFGQGDDLDIIESNKPPQGQPGLWCQWVPSEDGLAIEWDGGEKFYDYVEWLQYICDNFLAPKGYVLNGEVRFQGEESDDAGWVVCKKNRVTRVEGELTPIKRIPVKKIPAKKKVPNYKKALQALVDSAETEGCDGCATVSLEALNKARKALGYDSLVTITITTKRKSKS